MPISPFLLESLTHSLSYSKVPSCGVGCSRDFFPSHTPYKSITSSGRGGEKALFAVDVCGRGAAAQEGTLAEGTLAACVAHSLLASWQSAGCQLVQRGCRKCSQLSSLHQQMETNFENICQLFPIKLTLAESTRTRRICALG